MTGFLYTPCLVLSKEIFHGASKKGAGPFFRQEEKKRSPFFRKAINAPAQAALLEAWADRNSKTKTGSTSTIRKRFYIGKGDGKRNPLIRMNQQNGSPRTNPKKGEEVKTNPKIPEL